MRDFFCIESLNCVTAQAVSLALRAIYLPLHKGGFKIRRGGAPLLPQITGRPTGGVKPRPYKHTGGILLPSSVFALRQIHLLPGEGLKTKTAPSAAMERSFYASGFSLMISSARRLASSRLSRAKQALRSLAAPRSPVKYQAACLRASRMPTYSFL